ncbi:Ribonuclease P/MRP protein subunit POP5 [Sparassis crispa]|uniref:Ribonuclease P/MRP protein subunit POP5 n=1 Tax=Sparassis crispa TaxID=139825 RepID=A0A401H6U0_9APHY|nr:Ribonuclease P/MRP protein subunit POP5 [Sparassis crispa]GBE90101.1 Ribonuclease P/MRP protein subunit POP5 [Sparassis crispa]
MVRFKNRWLLVEFIPCSRSPAAVVELDAPSVTSGASEMNSKQIWSALKQSIIIHFGDTGWGAVGASLSIKYFSPRTNVCIIRVGRDQHRIAWAGVTLLTAIDGQRYVPNVIHVSGTIRHAQLAAIRHNREVIARYRTRAKTPAAYQDSYEEYLQTSTQEIDALQD